MNQKNKSKSNQFGEDVCSYHVNSLPLALMRNQMLNNGMTSLTNTFGGKSALSSEQYVINENHDVFLKKSLHEGNIFETHYYEALQAPTPENLTSNGEYLRFIYKPFVGNGEFEDVVLRHSEGEQEIYCKTFTNSEIDKMIESAPAHPVIILMTATLKAFSDLPQNIKPTENKKEEPTAPQKM